MNQLFSFLLSSYFLSFFLSSSSSSSSISFLLSLSLFFLFLVAACEPADAHTTLHNQLLKCGTVNLSLLPKKKKKKKDYKYEM